MTSSAQRVRAVLGRGVARLVGWSLPWIIRRSLRRGLRGVWLLGAPPELPPGAFVIAPNHHSWWDAYLVWLIAERLGRPAIALMRREQLARFPFFRHIGVLGDDEVRAALERLRGGEVLFVFPEGALRTAGPTGALRRGVSFFARGAAVPVLPVGLRVTLRGAQRPEAYLRFGTPLPPGEDLLVELGGALDDLLAAIDDRLAATHPEDVPHGATPWLAGRASTRDRKAWWESLWSR